jgi:REP element-mobilizing transposase RayT
MPLFRGDPGRKGPPHHSPIERDNLSVLIFLTVCTKDRKPRLASPEAHRVLKEWWNKAGAWLVGRYVILPDHVHLFCAPVLDVPLEKWVGYWKNGVARALKTGSEPLWQRDFWDTQLRRSDSYEAKWEYVQDNPVRHGLVTNAEAWPYRGEMHLLDWHDA